MENKNDNLRELDMDELETVTGGGLKELFTGGRIGDHNGPGNGTSNTNNSQDPKSFRPKLFQA